MNLFSIDQSQLEELGFWKDFGKGFKQGFGAVNKVANTLTAPCDALTGGACTPAVGIHNGINGLVQMIPGQQLQELGFWDDFSKGFKQGL